MEYPKNKAEAEKYRYGCWAGHPNGRPYDPKYCAQPTMTGGRASLPTQCGRSPGHGKDGIFCKKHSYANPETKMPEFSVWEVDFAFSIWIRETKNMVDETAKFFIDSSGYKRAKQGNGFKIFRDYYDAVECALQMISSRIAKCKRDIADYEELVKGLLKEKMK